MRAYLEDARSKGLVSMKECPNHPGLYVLKYSKKVFYKDLWDDHLEESRGTIVDADFNPVVLPFRKIYNFGIEKRAPHFDDDELVMVHPKVNGFMAAITPYKGQLIYSTTGSTTSDFVDYIKELASAYKLEGHLEEGTTYLFEACHPKDPHVIPEMPGLYYLGQRRTAFGTSVVHDDVLASALGCFYYWPTPCRVSELKNWAKRANHEGFVFYSMTDPTKAAKIKSPYYLATKLFGRASNLDVLLNGKAKLIMDEEFYPLIDMVRENKEEFSSMDEQTRMAWCRAHLETLIK
ncbi:RNA ligase [Acidovorax phage ACP17]|uniref:RNA ligase n=1 Tax=Acidovorax phage ACP17 TaxID=2010329 RepID=A0A218M373_9CAUD|nr:RNA ligase [Acidovorax phage ACP17]ASD50502.1 RNA ligase [Acidovorax phage ACP17]